MIKLLHIVVGLLYLTDVQGQTFDLALGSRLSSMLDSLQVALDVKGISVSMIVPVKGQWNGTAGESHVGAPIDEGMLFHLASNTKTFTAVTLLKLVENGQVDLDDSLHHWLPNYNPNIDSDITIRQLLNHTSGIANTFDIPGFIDSLSNNWQRIFTPQEILGWLPAPRFAPGTGQRYSNPNYNLVGLIVEKATSQPLERVIRDSILEPLGLADTYFPVFDTLDGVIAHPWHNGSDLISQARTSLLTANWASGAMYSTANDMANWYSKLMNGSILKEEILSEMKTFVEPQSRGLGVQEVSIAGIRAIGHGGGTLGYGSTMIYVPNDEVVIAVLVNEGDSKQFAVAEALLATLLSELSTTSTNIQHAPIVSVYPNPVFDKININIGNYLGIRTFLS